MMKSIRGYEGEVRICASCGQPSYLGPTECGSLWQHFSEQWDGVYCPRFPLAGQTFAIDWDATSWSDVRRMYPDTH
ncbi:hypothetical protein [Streptomyces sp. NPDC056105]|uniref:hypothetical protein n=1 Tax=Streptomyces sp. NPDC056105 TaxID=3345714 RepID=UPI0035E0A6E7